MKERRRNSSHRIPFSQPPKNYLVLTIDTTFRITQKPNGNPIISKIYKLKSVKICVGYAKVALKLSEVKDKILPNIIFEWD